MRNALALIILLLASTFSFGQAGSYTLTFTNMQATGGQNLGFALGPITVNQVVAGTYSGSVTSQQLANYLGTPTKPNFTVSMQMIPNTNTYSMGISNGTGAGIASAGLFIVGASTTVQSSSQEVTGTFTAN
jgi:hypothetical protein